VPDAIRRIDYYYVTVPDKPGEVARVLAAVRGAGVNLLGVLCCIVGVFVSIPVTFAAITIAYQEIVGFDQRTVDSLG